MLHKGRFFRSADFTGPVGLLLLHENIQAHSFSNHLSDFNLLYISKFVKKLLVSNSPWRSIPSNLNPNFLGIFLLDMFPTAHFICILFIP